MMQPVAPRTEGDQVLQFICAALRSWFDVMNLQEPAVPTTGRPASEAIAAQGFDSPGWGNGGGIGLAGVFDPCVALGTLGVGFRYFDFSPAGLYGGFSTIRAPVNVDLERGRENPPAGTFSRSHFIAISCVIQRSPGQFFQARQQDIHPARASGNGSCFARLFHQRLEAGELFGSHFQPDPYRHFCGKFFFRWGFPPTSCLGDLRSAAAGPWF